MSIHARPYTDADLPRLQAALARWTREAGDCGYCHVGEIPHRIYENLRERRPVGQLVQLWEEDAAIVGTAINLRFGCAFDVFSDPALRGTDAELEMLRSACKTTRRYLSQDEPEHTAVLTDVFACDRTRMQLLRRLGFEEYRVWGLLTERSLSEPIPRPTLPAGFTLRSASMADYEQLALARNAAFGADWTPALYRDAVMRKPGYEPEREIVVVAPDGRIAAFAVIWFDGLNRVGHFEPVGTHPDFQRRGLARSLILHAMRAMKRRSMATATVEHGADNLAAFALYRGLGFRKKHEILGYRRG